MTSITRHIPIDLVAFLGLWEWPPFDLSSALWVGGITVLATLVIVGLAIALPAVAIVAASTFAAWMAIAAIAVVIGIVAGIAAGLVEGRQLEVERTEAIEKLALDTRTIHIYFEPKTGNLGEAKEFTCLLTYHTITKKKPSIEIKKVTKIVTVASSSDFYANLERVLFNWFRNEALVDKDGETRIAKIYTKPDPGSIVSSRIEELIIECREEFSRRCEILISKTFYDDKIDD
jgi:hypothetical protein